MARRKGSLAQQFSAISEELLSRSHPRVRANRLPSTRVIEKLIPDIVHLLFPHYHYESLESETSLRLSVPNTMSLVFEELSSEIKGALLFQQENKENIDLLMDQADEITLSLLHALPDIRDVLECDLEEMLGHDPAAKSREEVILSYPGFYALMVHRLAHFLDKAKVPLIPRIMSEVVHSSTGIDIHPSAQISPYCSIDHGTGLIIGETTIIDEHVNLYHNVTLGSRSVSSSFRGKKRHPTIGKNVVVYPGATVLGDISVGEGSVIGGNVFLLDSCPPNSKIYAKPPEMICQKNNGKVSEKEEESVKQS